MSYASASDLRAKYDETELAQLTDPEGLVIDDDKLDQALADASDRIDGYLESRYPLPFSKPPRALKHLCCDMAMYALMTLRRLGDIEVAAKRNDAAIALLMKVAKGEVQLGRADDDSAVPTHAPAVLVAPAPQRTLSRDELSGL